MRRVSSNEFRARIGCCLALVVIATAGCGPRIADVTGVVTVNGAPQPGLKLIFEPESAKGQRAMAMTGADGGYTLGRQGLGNNKGAVTGRYTVRVYADPEDENAPKIPQRYGRESTVVFEVEPGRSNTFDIAIEVP